MAKSDYRELPKHALRQDFMAEPEESTPIAEPFDETTPETMPLNEPADPLSRVATVAEDHCHDTNGRCDKMPAGMKLQLKVEIQRYLSVYILFNIIIFLFRSSTPRLFKIKSNLSTTKRQTNGSMKS